MYSWGKGHSSLMKGGKQLLAELPGETQLAKVGSKWPPNSEPYICLSILQMDSSERKATESLCVSAAWAWEGRGGKGL